MRNPCPICLSSLLFLVSMATWAISQDDVDSKKITELVERLGKDAPAEREKAHSQLVALGEKARNEIAQRLKAATDPEVQARLRRILVEINLQGLAHGYFPLSDGRKWVYSMSVKLAMDDDEDSESQDEPTKVTLECSRLGDGFSLKFDGLMGEKQSMSWMLTWADGRLSIGKITAQSVEIELKKGICLLKLPPKSKEKWEGESAFEILGSKVESKYHGEWKAKEDVKIGDKTWKCWRAELVLDEHEFSGGERWVFWLAENVGIVQAHFIHKMGDTSFMRTLTLQSSK